MENYDDDDVTATMVSKQNATQAGLTESDVTAASERFGERGTLGAWETKSSKS